MKLFIACMFLCSFCLYNMADALNPLLLISFDGFRWDYLKKYPASTTWLNYLAKEGTHVEQVINTFSTKTFPCHWSIVTGLYEENHGIVSNKMYDSKLKRVFGKKSLEPEWWNATEPIWISAVKADLRAGVYFWVGSEVDFNGVRPTFYKKYDKEVSLKHRFQTVLEWLNSTQVHFVCLYFHQPDYEGHYHGPNSIQVETALKGINKDLGEFITQMKQLGLFETTNIIITSDHGITEIKSKMMAIELNDMLAKDTDYIYDECAELHIMPKKGNLKIVYNKLLNLNNTNFSVYFRWQLPERLHYRHPTRLPEIIVLAKRGYCLFKNTSIVSKYPFGEHGYDNLEEDMHPIFIAHGPNFKSQFQVKSIRQVDIYPLMCKILGIDPRPNNGSLENTAMFYKSCAQKCLAVNRFFYSILLHFLAQYILN